MKQIDLRLEEDDEVVIRTRGDHYLFILYEGGRLTVSNERTSRGAQVVEATQDGWKDVTAEGAGVPTSKDSDGRTFIQSP